MPQRSHTCQPREGFLVGSMAPMTMNRLLGGISIDDVRLPELLHLSNHAFGAFGLAIPNSYQPIPYSSHFFVADRTGCSSMGSPNQGHVR